MALPVVFLHHIFMYYKSKTTLEPVFKDILVRLDFINSSVEIVTASVQTVLGQEGNRNTTNKLVILVEVGVRLQPYYTVVYTGSPGKECGECQPLINGK